MKRYINSRHTFISNRYDVEMKRMYNVYMYIHKMFETFLNKNSKKNQQTQISVFDLFILGIYY